MADDKQEKLDLFLKHCRENGDVAERVAKDPKGTLEEYGLSTEDLPKKLADGIEAAGLSGNKSVAVTAAACG